MNVSPESITQSIIIPGLNQAVDIRREDLNHPLLSGNKLRKLKFNLDEARKQNYRGLLTFGGAFSNHILAVAASGSELGFKTIGFIRGEELQSQWQQNPTLKEAHKLGMNFIFLDRETYRKKSEEEFLYALKAKYPEYYIIPEGGTNELAIKGCEEILKPSDIQYDYICCAVGTGGTLSGLIRSSQTHQKIFGFSSLKGEFLEPEIRKFVKQKTHWEVITDFHFGGYGKITDELVAFMNTFYKDALIPLDPIYTGKMMYGIYQLFKRNYFLQDKKMLVIHTGGLQGIRGVNQVLKLKNKPQINYEIAKNKLVYK
jgi:1-aminocyclopropane-1-carboxylate deaminase